MPIFDFIGYLTASLAKQDAPCYNHLNALAKEVLRLTNNELFIDTMDKINSLAKSRGFVNGINWARTAAGTKLVNELELSAYENIHALRNLMAHGSARDISISNETLSEVLGFLSKIMSSTLRPAPVAPKEQTVDFSNPSYVQPGDIIFLPFFQGFVDFAKGGIKPTNRFGEAVISYNGFYPFPNFDSPASEIAGVFGQVTQNSVSFFVYDHFNLVSFPSADIDLYYIVLRPNDELKALILNKKADLLVTEYKLSDGKFSFKVVQEKTVRDYYNKTITKYEVSDHNCRAFCIKIGFTEKNRVAANESHYKLKNGMFIAFPPKGNQPYAEEVDTRFTGLRYFCKSYSKDSCAFPDAINDLPF